MAEARIRKVAELELGATVSCVARPLVIREIMNPKRDIRGHFISMVYKCKLTSQLRSEMEASNAEATLKGQWQWFSAMPSNMIKQHLQFEDLINQVEY